MPTIAAKWEAKIRNIKVPGQPGQKKKKVCKTLSLQEKAVCGVTYLSPQLLQEI
jgi:hypothetical protein